MSEQRLHECRRALTLSHPDCRQKWCWHWLGIWCMLPRLCSHRRSSPARKRKLPKQDGHASFHNTPSAPAKGDLSPTKQSNILTAPEMSLEAKGATAPVGHATHSQSKPFFLESGTARRISSPTEEKRGYQTLPSFKDMRQPNRHHSHRAMREQFHAGRRHSSSAKHNIIHLHKQIDTVVQKLAGQSGSGIRCPPPQTQHACRHSTWCCLKVKYAAQSVDGEPP